MHGRTARQISHGPTHVTAADAKDGPNVIRHQISQSGFCLLAAPAPRTAPVSHPRRKVSDIAGSAASRHARIPPGAKSTVRTPVSEPVSAGGSVSSSVLHSRRPARALRHARVRAMSLPLALGPLQLGAGHLSGIQPVPPFAQPLVQGNHAGQRRPLAPYAAVQLHMPCISRRRLAPGFKSNRGPSRRRLSPRQPCPSRAFPRHRGASQRGARPPRCRRTSG